MDLYLRVYVRLTKSHLFYYESINSYNTLGKIALNDVSFRFESKQKMLKWCTRTGRSYCFFALNNENYETWKARVLGNEPPALLRSSRNLQKK